MDVTDLKVGHTYTLDYIDPHEPCSGDCTPCAISNLLVRGFLPGTVFTVKQILGNNALLEFEEGGTFAVSLQHLTTCGFIEDIT